MKRGGILPGGIALLVLLGVVTVSVISKAPRIQAAGALRLALVEETRSGAFIAAATPDLVLVRIEGRLAVAVGGPGAVEMLEARGMHVRTWVPFDPQAYYATMPAGAAVPANALYSDAEIVLLRSDGPYPAELELSPGFFRVPQKSFARLLSPREPASAAGKTALVYDPYIASYVSQVSSSRIATDDTRLAAFLTRHTLTDSVQAAGTWIRNQFLGMGYTDVQYHTFTYQSTTQKNVVCTVPGTRFPNQYIIVDGHYDSISQQSSTNAPGADDNGTGVATILETARLLQGIPFDYSIRYICFAAEEQGLLGATAYANYAQSSGMQIKLLMNFDMIGYPQTSQWTTIIERDQGNSSSGNDAASYAYADTMRQAALMYTPLQVVHGNIYSSDYMPFESRGYVCIGVFENGDNPYYHTTGDTPSTVDFNYVRDEAKVLVATLMHVAKVSDPNAPVITAPLSQSLIEGQNLSFTVTATDLDNDPLTYGARHLPAGAAFDSTGTHLFSWTPTLSQAGEYDVLFIVNDGRGRSDSTTTHITVLDTAPKVASTFPDAWDTTVSASSQISARTPRRSCPGDAGRWRPCRAR